MVSRSSVVPWWISWYTHRPLSEFELHSPWWVSGLSGAAEVSGSRHVLTVGPIGSEDQTITIYRTDTGHGVAVGCWNDPANTVEDLAAEAQRRAPEHVEEYAVAEQLLRLRINEWEQQR